MNGLWWEDRPKRLEEERESLRVRGIKWSEDADAKCHGVMRFHLDGVPVDDETIDLVVTYPDLFPYFRFEISAPRLSLSYHQHRFLKTLCMIGRDTHNWYSDCTVGQMIEEQLRRVLAAGRAKSRIDAAEIEEHQAEPASAYYVYASSSLVVVEGDTCLSPSIKGGVFTVAMRRGDTTGFRPNVLRGGLLEVRDLKGRILWQASDVIKDYYNGDVFQGPWLRLDKPPPVEDANLLSSVGRADSRFKRLLLHPVEKVHVGVAAVVFSEDHSWGNAPGDGWIFICETVGEKRMWRLPPTLNGTSFPLGASAKAFPMSASQNSGHLPTSPLRSLGSGASAHPAPWSSRGLASGN